MAEGDFVKGSRRPMNANLTIALESAYWYGLNVSSRPDTEFLVDSGDVCCEFYSSLLGNNTNTLQFEVPWVRQWIRKIASDVSDRVVYKVIY